MEKMRYFEANDELAGILLNQGLIETTSERNKIKGKKSFKTSKQSRKEIYFDYININVINTAVLHQSLRLSEFELRLILLFLKMDSRDYSEISPNRSFDLSSVIDKIEMIKYELSILENTDSRKNRQRKLRRILAFFESIAI